MTSFSVIEHQADKAAAIAEVVRVLKPDGVFALSFDVCEPGFGMVFPPGFGQALTISQFESDIWYQIAFAYTDVTPSWNVKDVPAYLEWHRTTEKLHNYATGAAIVLKERVE